MQPRFGVVCRVCQYIVTYTFLLRFLLYVYLLHFDASIAVNSLHDVHALARNCKLTSVDSVVYSLLYGSSNVFDTTLDGPAVVVAYSLDCQ